MLLTYIRNLLLYEGLKDDFFLQKLVDSNFKYFVVRRYWNCPSGCLYISIKNIELINLIYYEFIVVIIPSRNVVTSHLPSPAWWKPPNGQSIHSQSVPDNSHQNVLHKMAPIPIWQLDKWIEFDNLWKWLNTFFQFYYRFLV